MKPLLCRRFDAQKGITFLVCRECARQIQDGEFFYYIDKRIVCDVCAERGVE